MRIAAAAMVLVLAGCTSAKDVDRPPSLVPPPDPGAVNAPSADPRIDELQTSMTELLERIDVLNARIAKLESGSVAAAAPAAVSTAEAAVATPPKPAAAPRQTAAPLRAA